MPVNNSISDKEFRKLLEKICKFEDNPDVAVSVSGGSDSMSLLYLMNNWIKHKGGTITALILDHKLRKNSTSECLQVKKWIKNLNIKTKILSWNERKPSSSLLETARKKRYEIVLNECKNLNIMHLLVGHQLNDNIETYKMRAQRKGNIIGLSSISPLVHFNSVRIIRPFLQIKKKRLEETCKLFLKQWINDPTNSCEKYERIRIRKYLSGKKNQYFLDIQKNIRKYVNKTKNIEKEVSNFFLKNLYFYNCGVFEFKKEALYEYDNDIQVEIIKRLLTSCSGKSYPPKKKSVNRLIYSSKSQQSLHTLHSSIIETSITKFKIYRESFKTSLNMKNGLSIKKNNSAIWDYRFRLSCQSDDIVCSVINSKNWFEIKKNLVIEKYYNINFEIIKSLPLIHIKKIFLIPFLCPKLMHENKISFFFNPKTQLTNNNF